jgi:hypothetical protein
MLLKLASAKTPTILVRGLHTSLPNISRALRVVLSLTPDDKLYDFGMLAADTGADARMLARSDCITLDTVREELRFFSRSGWYSMNEAKKNGEEVISLIRDLGPRGSIALGAYTTGLFALVGVRPKIKATSSSVVIEY